MCISCSLHSFINTVDGRNCAPVDAHVIVYNIYTLLYTYMYIEIYMNEYRSETKQTWEILHINWWSPDFFHSECELSSYCIGGGWLSNRMPVHGRIRTVARAHPPKEPVHHSWLTVSFCKGDHVSISQTIHAHKNLPWRNIFFMDGTGNCDFPFFPMKKGDDLCHPI